tara:strand:- start:439 stop:3378 length:2940 start_codon:yes stop_codon:yes gene_type:complete
MIVPIFAEFAPLLFVSCAVAMVVLRAGASRVFFDIVGTFQAGRLIQDAEAASVAMQALFIDGLAGIEEAASEINQQFEQLNETLIPLGRNVALARIEFAKFFDESANAAMAAQEVIALGESYGFVAESALEAGSRVAQLRTIYGDAAITPIVEAGIAFGMIGEMEAADAQRKLISLMQQNNLVLKDMTAEQYNNLTATQQAEHMTRVLANTLNELNSVEDTSAARMSEVVDAMNEFGGAARLAGDDIDFMAAMTATLIERGVTAEKTGTALRFMYGRIGGNISGAADMLRQYGVESQNADGSLRSMEQVLGDLSQVWPMITENERRAISQSIAGNRHFSRISLLMNDYSRTLELVGNAQQGVGDVMTESGDAMGYLAERLEDTSVNMDITQAKIDNVQAALGERLLPAQLRAMEAQLALNQAMMGFAKGLEDVPGLGQLTNKLLESRAIISTMFAPYFTALINMQAMVLSLQLLRQIQRSLNGEQIAAMKEKLSLSGAQTITQQEQLLLDQKKGLLAERRGQAARIQFANENMSRSTQNRRREQGRLIDEQILEVQKNINRLIALRVKAMEAGNLLRARSMDMSVAELEVHEADLLIQGTKNEMMGKEYWLRQKIINATVLGMASASLGLMLFGMEVNRFLPKAIQFESQADVMAATMMLMAGSMMVTLVPLTTLTGSLTTFTVAITSSAVATQFQTATSLAKANADLAVTASTTAATGAQTSYLAVLGATIIAGLKFILVSAGKVLNLMAEGIAYLFVKGVMGGLILVNTALVAIMTKENWIRGYSIARTYALATAEAVATIAKLAMAGASTIAAGAMSALAIATAAASKALIVFLALTGVGIAIIAIAAAAVYAAKKLGLFNNEMEEFNYTASETNAMAGDFDFGEQYASQMALATGANDDFKNSREELFFGFKAGNVQGALIKQVQQQGVENFIVNTEVIQTNNFNGLTIDDVANQILDLIDKEASSRGVNLTLAG